MISKKIIIIPVIISILAALFVVYSNVSAVNTSSSYFHGYSSFRKFDFCGSGSSSTLHRVLCGGVNDDQVSDGGVFSKSKFISYIESLLSSSESSNKVGASFIIHTMIGKSSPDGTPVPTADEIKDWKARLNSGNIVVTSEIMPYEVNSGYVESNNAARTPDDKFYPDKGSEISWVFRDSGDIKYVIKKKCANPIGEFDGLPAATGWSISASTTVDKSSASVDDIVTWTHTISKSGAGTASVDSNIGFQNFSNISNKGENTVTSGVSIIRTFSDSYKIKLADAGKKLCERAQYSPQNSELTPDGFGVYSCVTISAPVAESKCDPIQIDVNPKTYPAVSHPAPDKFYYTAATTVPVNVVTSKRSWNGISSKTSLFVTTEFTTGDQYTVSFVEQNTHVVSYRNVDVTNYDDPHYAPIYEPIYETTGYNADGTPIYSENIIGYTSNVIGYDTSNIIGYGTKYDHSEPVYSVSGAGDSSTSIGPCYNFNLTAGVSPLSSDYVESNSAFTISVNPTIINQSNTSKAYIPITHTGDYTNWQLTQLVIQPYAAFPGSFASVGSSNSSPCDYYDPGRVYSCSVARNVDGTPKSGVGRFSSPDGNGYATNGDAMRSFDADIGNYAAGTKVCFVFSVQPRAGLYESDNTDDRWSHSALTLTNNCVIIVKKPKVQIWGGDLYAKTSVSTSTSIKRINGTSSMFGSWVEYGIYSAGLVKGAASGAAFAGSGLVGYNSACNYSLLSFANVTEGNTSCVVGSEKIGYYNASLPDIDVAASFPITSSTPTVTSNLDNLQGTYTATGNVTITGGNIKKGQWIVINAPNANITISGNINYTDETLNSVMDIPQVVIIAGNINITDNVANVDSWLMASGSLNTCSSVSTDTKLTINICNQELVINGPVSAGKIYLRRTAGSNAGAASGDPAEVINLRADAYLWSAARATSIGKVHTVYTTELPPRF